MTRQSFIQIDHVIWDKTDPDCPLNREPEPAKATVMSDLSDFVSPIDGKHYSGRAGLREHCKRHNVVPTDDCKGLPLRPPQPDRRQERDKIARVIADKVYRR